MKRTALEIFNKNNINNNNNNQNSLSLPKLSQPANSSSKNSSTNLILKSPNSKFRVNNNTKANSTPSFNTIVSSRPERPNNIKSNSSIHVSNNLSNVNNLNVSSDRIEIGTQTEEIFFKMHWSYFIGHFPILSYIPDKSEKVNQNFVGKKLTRKLNSNREKNNSLQFINSNYSNIQNNYFNNLLNGEKLSHGFSGNYNINITLNSLAKGAILLNKLPIKKPINNIYSFNRNAIINHSNGNNNNNNNNNNFNQNAKVNLKTNTKHRSNYSMNNIEQKNFV
jgi:hypothetical protein